MRRSNVPQRVAPIAMLACLGMLALSGPGTAQSSRSSGMATTAPEPLAQDAPQRSRTVRARPRIRVQPRYPYRSYHTIYPPSYDIEYPGPNAVRQCTSRLVTEHRLSGTVVVPRMRCWWVQR